MTEEHCSPVLNILGKQLDSDRDPFQKQTQIPQMLSKQGGKSLETYKE